MKRQELFEYEAGKKWLMPEDKTSTAASIQKLRHEAFISGASFADSSRWVKVDMSKDTVLQLNHDQNLIAVTNSGDVRHDFENHLRQITLNRGIFTHYQIIDPPIK